MLISRRDQLEAMAAELVDHPKIAVDTEFIREKTFYPQIALIQVATLKKTWLIDPLAFSVDEIEPLLEILRNPKILKVMHAAYSDQECFYWSYKMMAEPVFDTAVGGALLGMGDNIGLGKLTRDVLDITLPKGRARAKWLQRPLPQELENYAAMDVTHLVELADILEKKLTRLDRFEWALEESHVDSSGFDVSPLDFTRKLAKSATLDDRGRKVLYSLVEWRENRARTGDRPRNWVASNETLVALAKSQPKSLKELQSYRGLNPRELSSQGPQMIAAIHKGLERNDVQIESTKRRSIKGEFDERAADLIKTYANFLAAELKLASKFLLSGERYQLLLGSAHAGPDEWVRRGILSPRAADLVGEKLRSFLDGQSGLVLRNGTIELVEMKG